MSKPRLLDLYCGGGGATRGYQLAGWHVTGVDIERQPRYIGDAFVQADATTFPLDGFDAVHASPVCKGYSQMNAYRGIEYPQEVALMVARLEGVGVPFIVENVPGARKDMRRGLLLCGTMFGLPVIRHRIFESNVLLFAPGTCDHTVPHLIFGDATSRSETAYRDALGVPWMRARDDARQAIPPAYTYWLGRQLIDALEQAA